MRWRVIPLDTYSGYRNMSIDEAISENVAKNISEPTIRFYRWSPSAVSVGRFQSLEEEVNIENCRLQNVDYLRRITGGGAVYHDENGEITYSIIAPQMLFRNGIRESYEEICGYIINALTSLNIKSVFAPINDILVNNRKISGNAQARKNKILLQHGTILYDTDIKKMFTLLNVSKEKISDKMIKNAEERVTSIKREVPGITIEEVYNALLKAFTQNKEFRFGTLTSEEIKMLPELEKKYKSKEWNFYR